MIPTSTPLGRTLHRVYRPDERPDIEVLVDGVWCEGELRMRTQREDGTWQPDVQWRPNGEPTRRLDSSRPPAFGPPDTLVGVEWERFVTVPAPVFDHELDEMIGANCSTALGAELHVAEVDVQGVTHAECHLSRGEAMEELEPDARRASDFCGLPAD